SDVQVVCFTATQIPDIHGRMYPPQLAGERYPQGIPIHAEEDLEKLIAEHDVDKVALAYSDLPHEFVMHQGARVNAAGAEFCMLGAEQTMLRSRKPVIAVCAVRTGCGKSQVSRAVSAILKEMGKKVAAIRHPMPYGDLDAQRCQRFATLEDMDRHECTIEEREEYEPHIVAGNLVFAGVDYEMILREAEKEVDVILWDGGNNDTPFFRPDLYITIVDPHRPGHEVGYYPGETNLRLADLVIVNKVDTAEAKNIERVEANARSVNPAATILRADSPVTIEDGVDVKGKKVLVVEDGPTLTHGEMTYGAGHVAARNAGAAEIVDPRPYAKGSIRATFEKYRHLTEILPAMGYGSEQMAELEATINAVPCDVVLIGTPIDLGRLLKINKPSVRVRYEMDAGDKTILPAAIERAIGAAKPAPAT
ncbi:MAG: cyclic 2,3-diphosphoglycerate synthase, partial [Planctomycetota bacterium]|nr:cyclic 2,3-diphosphoglycerate synthase [Planctomycetota bacterium]